MAGTLALSLAAALLGAGCSAGLGARTPTPSTEDVIRTAEAMAEATRLAATPTPSPAPVTATATPTATPAVSPTPEATATPAISGPVVTANYPVSVRLGPGEAYEQVDLFLTGQMARVIGRFDDTPIGTWFLVVRIDVGKDGWVWSGAVTLTGDPALIPLATPSA